QDIRIELNRSEWKWVKCERYLLDTGSLRLLAKSICPLPEGQAAVAADLLARLLLLFDAYRRLLHEQELEQHTQVSAESIWKMESELRQYLTPEEQRELITRSCWYLPGPECGDSGRGNQKQTDGSSRPQLCWRHSSWSSISIRGDV
ncbi:MAG: hypothetical protein C5B58_07575, partial [Acidobacteria bacterium]